MVIWALQDGLEYTEFYTDLKSNKNSKMSELIFD